MQAIIIIYIFSLHHIITILLVKKIRFVFPFKVLNSGTQLNFIGQAVPKYRSFITYLCS